MSGPLEGIKVVDCANYVTGPYAAMILGDLGAEVVKVEPPPRGDPFRNFGLRHKGTSVMFANVNRGKRSCLLDLKSPDGKEALLALAGRADVIVQNWRPGIADGLGVGDDVLAARNPSLVRLAVSGYGPDGPLAGRPTFDTLLQAQTGLAFMQGRPGRPAMLRNIIVDKTTGLLGAQAVLAALVGRERHGAGERIDLAMLDVTAYTNFPDLMQDRTFLPDEGPEPELRPAGRGGVAATSDGYIAVAPVSGAQIGRTMEAIGHPEWRDDLKAISDPVSLADTMIERVEQVTRDAPTAEWLMRFADFDVPAAPVLDLDGHLGDEQVVHQRIYTEIRDPHLGRMRRVRYPGVYREHPLPDPGRVPAAGEHTLEILAELAQD